MNENSSLNTVFGALLSDSSHEIQHSALERAVVLLRDESNRKLVTKPVFSRVCQLYAANERHLPLRFIANAVADCEQNRYFLVENLEFIKLIAQRLKIDDSNTSNYNDTVDTMEINFIMSLIFNFSNDFDPGVSLITSETKKLPQYLITIIARYFKDSQFMMQIAIEILQLFLKTPEAFPTNSVDILLEVSTQILEPSSFEGDGEDGDIETGPIELLMRLIESDQRFEHEFVGTQKFDLLLRVALLTFDDVEIRQHSLSALGNISSQPEFSLNIDSDNSIFRKIVEMIHDNSRPMVVACAACILGNLSTTAEAVGRIMELIPDLVPTVMKMLKETHNPFEMQATHLLKNLAVSGPEVRSQIRQHEPEKIVDNLLGVAVFPQVRQIGVQFAKFYLDEKVVDSLYNRLKVEDDESVKSAIFLAMTAAVEAALEQNLDLSKPLETLASVDQMIRQEPVNKWNSTALIKTTKALGLVSARSPDALDGFPLEALLESSDEMKRFREQSSEGDKSLFDPVIKNLGFIAANLMSKQPKDDLTEACDKAVRNATEL